MDVLITVLAVVALLLPATSILSAIRLVRADRQFPGSDGLHERAQAQVVLAILSTGVGIIAAAQLKLVAVPDPLTTLILIAVLLGVSVPGLWWWWRFR